MFDYGSQDQQSPIIQYLSWQIEQHELQIQAIKESIRTEAGKDLRNADDFELFQAERINHFLQNYKRLCEQRDRLKRERLRLIGDIDFEGSNYLTR